jgi:WD40 repeat protein
MCDFVLNLNVAWGLMAYLVRDARSRSPYWYGVYLEIAPGGRRRWVRKSTKKRKRAEAKEILDAWQKAADRAAARDLDQARIREIVLETVERVTGKRIDSTGKMLHVLRGHTGRIMAVAITADGGQAVSASSDQTLRLWDLKSGETFYTLECHTGRVSTVAVTPDGGRAVSAGADKTLRVWDLQSGRILSTLRGHTAEIIVTALTAEGCRAVSVSRDQTLRVWDLRSGQMLRTLKRPTAS